MKYQVVRPEKSVQDTINLPSSKSISNRLLIITNLTEKPGVIDNLSDSDDTRVLATALESGNRKVVDVGHAGTSMRFLTAYYAVQHGERILTGSPRMKQRPIGELVNALRSLGAGIEYLENEGCPPLRISGDLQEGGEVSVKGNISSQFISALMMIGPVLQKGLVIHLEGEVVSPAYIEMTRSLMIRAGISVQYRNGTISVPESAYRPVNFTVESDWSAASYWYEVMALSAGGKIFLKGLQVPSDQGDSVLVSLFENLGVKSIPGEEGVVLEPGPKPVLTPGKSGRYESDFTSCPDLVQSLVPTLCGSGIPFRITGTGTLRIKETDRIDALITEMKKLGFVLKTNQKGEWISWEGEKGVPLENPEIHTYNDHRMAMAFAPMAILSGRITIRDPMVVSKSYPGFWSDLSAAGFRIKEI